MLRFFAIKNSYFNDDEAFEKYLASADGARREKVNNLALRERKNQSLAAGAILPLALKKAGYCGFKIGYGENGKPLFTEPQGLFFNLSHSGEWTVAALSDCEVGCDIQRVGRADMRLAERFFSEEERNALLLAGDGATELFFRIWTVKESYLKASGIGLSRPLDSFTVRFIDGRTEIADPLSEELRYVVEIAAPAGYRAACCVKFPHPAPRFEEIILK